VGVLARFANRPIAQRWDAMSCLMRFFKGTVHYGLLYQKYLTVLEGHNDIDWNTLSSDSLSTTNYVFTLSGVAIY
jgi:hypothetical protein